MLSPARLQQSGSRPPAIEVSRRVRRAIVCAVGTVFLAAAASAPRVVIHTAAEDPVTVTVELADTPAKRERGLMFRTELAAAHGMLFVFERDMDHTFWMKNTPLSLDIIFIDQERRIVGIQTDTVPYSERQLRVGRPSRYVLEVVAGFCARHGIKPGDRVDLPEAPPGGRR
jgi:hypothetical protein